MKFQLLALGLGSVAALVAACDLEPGSVRGGTSTAEYLATVATGLEIGAIVGQALTGEQPTGIVGSSSDWLSYSADPAPAPSGSAHDCQWLGEEFEEDYNDYSGYGACEAYIHQSTVLKYYRDELVSAGCVDASQWDSAIRQSNGGIRAVCE